MTLPETKLRETPLASIDEAIRSRRSVRAFLPDEIPDLRLREIFELAQCAPSNCNVQPWTPHVVSGDALRKLRDALVAAADADAPPNPDWPVDGKYSGVYRDRQIDAAVKLYSAMGVERRDLVARKAAFIRNFEFFDAPHVAFIFMRAPFDTREAADAGMYAQTLMLAMSARGISSCAQGALSFFPDIVREHLGVPKEMRLLFGVSFGFEDGAAGANAVRIGRATFDDAVRFHR